MTEKQAKFVFLRSRAVQLQEIKEELRPRLLAVEEELPRVLEELRKLCPHKYVVQTNLIGPGNKLFSLKRLCRVCSLTEERRLGEDFSELTQNPTDLVDAEEFDRSKRLRRLPDEILSVSPQTDSAEGSR